MSHRRLLALALIAGLPGFAGAQFTTFIPPKNKVADSVKAVVVAQETARADTALNMRLTNMKIWVDSAAGITAQPMTAADSLATAQGTTTVRLAEVTTTTAMANGTRAPATASALPLFALIGVGAIGVGAFLLVGPEPARSRTKHGA
jgi:cytochrome b